MEYIVYLTKNLVNNKIYVGVHKTENSLIFDGYYGNGINIKDQSKLKHPKEPFHYALKKYGFKNFNRTVIKSFDNLEDALKLESEIVNEDFIKRPDTYNTKISYKEGDYYQYSLEGEFIQTFTSRKELINHFGCNMDGINRSIRMGKPYKEFLWLRGEKLESVKPYKLKEKTRKVGQYTLNGELVKIYNTVREARKDFSNVNKVLKGQASQCKGYTFKYIS